MLHSFNHMRGQKTPEFIYKYTEGRFNKRMFTAENESSHCIYPPITLIIYDGHQQIINKLSDGEEHLL